MKSLSFVTAVVFLFLSSLSFADYVGKSALFEIEKCSGYLFASDDQHQTSALANYEEEAADECRERGYTDHESIAWAWKPGINVTHYCIKGTVRCK